MDTAKGRNVVGVGEGRRDGFRTRSRWCEGCGIFNPSGVVFLSPLKPGVRFATLGYLLVSLRDRERGHGDRLRRVQEGSWRRLQLDLDGDGDADTDTDADGVGSWKISDSSLKHTAGAGA